MLIIDIVSFFYVDIVYYVSFIENGIYSNGMFNYLGFDEVVVFNVFVSEVFV